MEVCEQGPEANERLLGGKLCAVSPRLREDGSPPWRGVGAMFANRKMGEGVGMHDRKAGPTRLTLWATLSFDRCSLALLLL